MPLMEHLIELRRRLLISFMAIFLCAIVVFIFYNPVLHFLSGPYRQVTKNSQGCGKSGCDLIVTDPLAPFLVRLKIAGYGGLALSVPIVMWEIWRFIVPGLHQRERRYAVGFLVSAIVLFLLGCVVAWFTVTKALSFLLGVGGHSLRPLIDANKYLTLVMLMFAAFGFAVPVPVAVGVPHARRCGEYPPAAQHPALGGRRDHDVRGDHHSQPRSILSIVHGHSHVHLL